MDAEQKIIVGLDEAGRGPLAGPVSAASVILPKNFPVEILNDSKKLSAKKREEAYLLICKTACWGQAFVDHKTIDEINILQASLLAMKNAYEKMLEKLPLWCAEQGWKVEQTGFLAIVDGLYVPQIECESKAVVKADSKYAEVMAASIIAKVSRDYKMLEYDKLYPEYGYAKHKGYPTKAHKEICKKLGASPIQRLSFSYR